MAITDRRARERERRRTEILDAAATLFAERGVEGASMDAIADRAELGKATLYYYFSTKAQLHLAVLETGAELFFTELARVQTAFSSPADMVEALLEAFLRFCRQNTSLLHTLAPHLAHFRLASGGATPGGHPMVAAPDDIPLHNAFIVELERLLATSPWSGRSEDFMDFLTDVFASVARLFLAGREDAAEARVAFYVDLIRNYLPGRGTA
jgi:AcrR family transcriptional regulator